MLCQNEGIEKETQVADSRGENAGGDELDSDTFIVFSEAEKKKKGEGVEIPFFVTILIRYRLRKFYTLFICVGS